MASRIVTSLVVVAASLSCASVASADPTPLERTLAQSLFDEARNAMDAGHLDEACEKFGRSQKLDPGGGTVLNLAVCHEKQGKVATAWTEFNEAFSAAVRDNRQDRASFAREMIDKLKARLPHLVITIAQQQVPYMEVRVDGITLPPAAIGVPAPLDPGSHLIEAGAYLRTPFHQRVELAEGESKSIEIPALPFVPGVAPPPPSCPEGRELKGDRCVEKKPTEPEAPKKLSSASFIFGGVGAASLVAFGVTGVLALTAHSDANQVCNLDRNYCATDDGYSAASRARTFAWVSTITLGVGVTSGFTAWLLPRERVTTKKPVALRLGPFGGAIAGEF